MLIGMAPPITMAAFVTTNIDNVSIAGVPSELKAGDKLVKFIEASVL